MRLLNGYRLTAKIKLHSKEKYHDWHPSYGFIATGGIICRDRLAKEVVKHPKLLWKIETKHFTLKYKPLEFFGKKNVTKEGKKKQLLRAKTFTNVSALKTHSSLLKQRRPGTITEELVLSAPKDILWASDSASCNHEWRGLWKNAKLAKKEPERMRREIVCDQNKQNHSFIGVDLGFHCDDYVFLWLFLSSVCREFKWDFHLVLYHVLVYDESRPSSSTSWPTTAGDNTLHLHCKHS